MSRFDPFAAVGPRWYSIAAHRPFLDDLADGVLEWLGTDAPETLGDAIILLPNRRAARAFTEAVSRRSAERPVLLPQVRPLGDLEEDEPPFTPGALDDDLPPPISALRRRFELARLIRAHHDADLEPLHALEMAEALGRFLDSCQIEEVSDPGRVADLVEADMAGHWQASAAFLAIAVDLWPARLREMGLSDPAARRVTLLRRLAELWDARPPTAPVIAAGSTGTVPAAAAVLGAVARAPRGCVVLPGLDLDLSQRAWDRILGDDGEQHPQGALKRLIDSHGVARAGVRPWPAREPVSEAMAGRARRRLIAEALKPPPSTADWLEAIAVMREEGGDPVAEGLVGLHAADARTEESAAALAAALLRETLETPGRTAALVTPDVQMARRVQARLSRWGLMADSSAGASLATTSAGAMVGLAAEIAAGGFGSAPLLAVLKHSWTTLGLAPDIFAKGRRALERLALRGPHPADGAAIRRRLTMSLEDDHADRHGADDAGQVLDRLLEALEPLASTAGDRLGIDARAADLARAVEAVAGGADCAWLGPDGEAASRLLAGLIADGAEAEPLTGHAFQRFLAGLIQAEAVRTGGDTHPRLRILGAIEARLVRADRVVLAGLEEGVWPRAGGADPFLSRPMRKALGLPPPERRVGLSAHDFAQIACVPEVYLLHTERRGGQPSTPSRWLWRLRTLVRGAFGEGPQSQLPTRPEIGAWATGLDAADPAPPPSLRPATRPEPRPPLEARPTGLSVTRVEEWVRDPYATYARFVLDLKQMSRPDERVDARIRGTAIHDALHKFAEDWPSKGAADGPARFESLYVNALLDAGLPRTGLAREAVLGANIGRWATEWEAQRRADRRTILLEQFACWPFDPGDGETFTLSARADRIEVRDRAVTVIDFKTGAAPSGKQVRTGFSPQLSLTAAMCRAGAFGAEGEGSPEALLYISVTGRTPPARIEDRSGDTGAAAAADDAMAGLRRRILQYRNATQPYRSRTAPAFAQRAVSDYDHLARVAEWSAATEEEGE